MKTQLLQLRLAGGIHRNSDEQRDGERNYAHINSFLIRVSA